MKIYKTIYVKSIKTLNSVIFMDKKNNHYSLISKNKFNPRYKKGWIVLNKVKMHNRFLYINNDDNNKFKFIRSGIFAR
jgi:hypothetical protein